MASPADLLNRSTGAATSETTTFAGRFSRDADSVEDTIPVVIPAFHPAKDWGPCRWMPRVDDDGEVILPLKDDDCVVCFAQTGDPGTPEIWVVAWWPS